MVSTQHYIRQGESRDALKIAAMLLRDSEDLMHKAGGWMLREVGKRDERRLLVFLEMHAGRMPRTALRYAIERLPDAQRKFYMARPRSPRR